MGCLSSVCRLRARWSWTGCSRTASTWRSCRPSPTGARRASRVPRSPCASPPHTRPALVSAFWFTRFHVASHGAAGCAGEGVLYVEASRSRSSPPECAPVCKHTHTHTRTLQHASTKLISICAFKVPDLEPGRLTCKHDFTGTRACHTPNSSFSPPPVPAPGAPAPRGSAVSPSAAAKCKGHSPPHPSFLS